MQLLLQLRFGRQFGPVPGHGDVVFVHLQQLHLFVAGFGAEGEADGRFDMQGGMQLRVRGAQRRGDAVFHRAAPLWRRWLPSNADVPIAQTNVAMDAMPPL